MQLAIDIFIEMIKSKEFYILIIGIIVIWIVMERMDR
jgi:hypothetical protein